jgi:hypothetical protein
MDLKFSNLSLYIFLLLAFLVGFRANAQLVLTSTETVTVSARVGDEPEPGIGTSGSLAIPKTTVRFSGQAYPWAMVTLLSDGVEKTSVNADIGGSFSITIVEDNSKTFGFYTLYAKDPGGNKSLLINYPLVIASGMLTHLSGIKFAPTIVIDKTEVKMGEYLTVTGYALPNKDLLVTVEGKLQSNFNIASAADGTYKGILPMQGLTRGDYSVYIKYSDDSRTSKHIRFVIGNANISSSELEKNIPGDCNADRVINLSDFSVLAFWYGRTEPPACVDTNKDSKIDLTDFSILAFWWTG